MRENIVKAVEAIGHNITHFRSIVSNSEWEPFKKDKTLLVVVIVLNTIRYTELRMITVVCDTIIVIAFNRILYTEHKMISVVCDTVPTMELTHNGFPQSL